MPVALSEVRQVGGMFPAVVGVKGREGGAHVGAKIRVDHVLVLHGEVVWVVSNDPDKTGAVQAGHEANHEAVRSDELTIVVSLTVGKFRFPMLEHELGEHRLERLGCGFHALDRTV